MGFVHFISSVKPFFLLVERCEECSREAELLKRICQSTNSLYPRFGLLHSHYSTHKVETSEKCFFQQESKA